MPKRTDISSILISSLPRGEGLGMGGTAVMRQRDCSGVVNPSPTPSLEGRGLSGVAGEVQFFEDRGEHAVGVLQHVVVPEADDAVAVGFDDLRSSIIGRAVSVLATIEFDGEARGAAGEVDHEGADRQLPRELDTAQLAGAQVRPKASFRVGHIVSQFARDAGQSFLHYGRTPIPNPFPQGKGLSVAKPA